MTKILGYTDGEIAKLYLLATTIVVIVCAALSVLVGTLVMRNVWTVMLQSMSGWFTFIMGPLDYIKMFAFIFVGYLVVMLFDFRRIRKIPLDEALKRVEQEKWGGHFSKEDYNIFQEMDKTEVSLR